MAGIRRRDSHCSGYGSGWQGSKKATVEGSLVLTARFGAQEGARAWCPDRRLLGLDL